MRHRRLSSFAVRSAVLTLPLILAACGGEETGTTGPTDTTSTTQGTAGSGGTGGSGGGNTAGGGTGGVVDPQPVYRKTVTGDVTWTVTFDDTAKAAGATDCTYTRHYQGIEDRSAHWLCPDCEIMFSVDVQVVSGLDDCFAQVSSAAPNLKEWIGYANGIYRRGAGGPMTEQGTATVTDTSIAVVNLVEGIEASVGGTLKFDVAGTLTVGEEEGDPMNGWVPPAQYACGWPKANPEPYTGDYLLKKGATLPDGLFKDKCQETVRLHDFKGDYLIVDMSAIDCPPCQAMASEEEAFIADMDAMGIKVNMVTLLCPSLSNVLGNTTTSMLKVWSQNYDLTSPVLGDRGWGISIFEPAIGADQIGYPSWVVVDKNLKVIEFATGYDSFDTMKSIILADAP